MQIVSVIKRENILGEGPLWAAAEQRLYWVDIDAQSLEWTEPLTDKSGTWHLDRRASAMAERKQGGFLLATDRGFALFDPGSGHIEHVHHPEPDRPFNRSNDGHADARGRFWLGTMDDSETRQTGAIYRLDPDWACTRVMDGLGIPNTILCTPDGNSLYVADSKAHTLYIYDVDFDSGELSSGRVFARSHDAHAAPDGSALDAEGYLWNAEWGGWRLVRYAPDGKIDQTVPLPVEQPTSCAFGGEDLSHLYVTTARKGLSPAALATQPLAGSVLCLKPPAPGVPVPPFGG
jgi:L-arabinonolactonase